MVGACSRSTIEPIVEGEQDIPEWSVQKPDIVLGDDPQSRYQQLVVEREQAMQDFQVQHLAIGKESPEIEGEDADGEFFRLSDYRGSIVLLDFWGDW